VSARALRAAGRPGAARRGCAGWPGAALRGCGSVLVFLLRIVALAARKLRAALVWEGNFVTPGLNLERKHELRSSPGVERERWLHAGRGALWAGKHGLWQRMPQLHAQSLRVSRRYGGCGAPCWRVCLQGALAVSLRLVRQPPLVAIRACCAQARGTRWSIGVLGSLFCCLQLVR